MSTQNALPLRGDLDVEKTPAQMDEPPAEAVSQPPKQQATKAKATSPLDAAIAATKVTYVPFDGREPITLSFDDATRFLANPTKSGKLPSDREVMLFLKKNQMLGLNPWTDDSYLLGYDTKDGPKFSTIVSHAAMLKRAESHGEYDGKESGVLCWDKETRELLHIDGDVYPTTLALVGSWCRVYRRDRTRPEYSTCKWEAYAKEWGHWKIDPGWMIRKCAEAKALRAAFPSQCQGMYVREELGTFDEGEIATESTQPQQSRRVSRLAQRVAQRVAQREEKAAT